MPIEWDVIDRLAGEAARRAAEIEHCGELPTDLLDAVLDAGLLRSTSRARERSDVLTHWPAVTATEPCCRTMRW